MFGTVGDVFCCFLLVVEGHVLPIFLQVLIGLVGITSAKEDEFIILLAFQIYLYLYFIEVMFKDMVCINKNVVNKLFPFLVVQ